MMAGGCVQFVLLCIVYVISYAIIEYINANSKNILDLDPPILATRKRYQQKTRNREATCLLEGLLGSYQ